MKSRTAWFLRRRVRVYCFSKVLRLRRLAAQAAERRQVLHVEGILDDRAGAGGPCLLGGLDQQRPVLESRIVQQATEGFETEAAFPDVLVPIDAAAARLLGVVAVKHLHAIESDQPVERGERAPVSLFADDVVARGDQVAGVETDADSWRAVEMPEDRGEVLEPVTDGPPLAGGMFEQYHRPALRPGLECRPNRLADQAHRVVLGAGRAGSRMDDDAEQAEGDGTIELVDERVDRLFPQVGERGGQVDQVTGV